MSIRLVIAMTLAVGGIGFEYDPGTGNDISRYQNTQIVVSDGIDAYQIQFQYVHTFATSFTLTIRIHNTLYQNVLIYTQKFASPRTVQRSITVPAYLVHRQTEWRLSGSSTSLQRQWVLTSQPRPQETWTLYQHTQWVSQASQMRINQIGEVVTIKEHVLFHGMLPKLMYEYYGIFHVHPLTLTWLTMPEEWFSRIHAYLLIAFHPAFEDFTLHDEGDVIIPLTISAQQNTIHFSFPTLYVNPATLRMSDLPLEGYVATNHLFFPIHQFHELQMISMTLLIEINHIVEGMIRYPFLYEALNPLLGPCLLSQYCVRIPYA